MADTQWSRLEADLVKVPGVRSARVIGANGAPTEIHIVSTSSRAPKQVVRDVQSLATAGFGIQIDHRIVSIVQLDEPLEPDPPPVPEAHAAVRERTRAAPGAGARGACEPWRVRMGEGGAEVARWSDDRGSLRGRSIS